MFQILSLLKYNECLCIKANQIFFLWKHNKRVYFCPLKRIKLFFFGNMTNVFVSKQIKLFPLEIQQPFSKTQHFFPSAIQHFRLGTLFLHLNFRLLLSHIVFVFALFRSVRPFSNQIVNEADILIVFHANSRSIQHFQTMFRSFSKGSFQTNLRGSESETLRWVSLFMLLNLCIFHKDNSQPEGAGFEPGNPGFDTDASGHFAMAYVYFEKYYVLTFRDNTFHQCSHQTDWTNEDSLYQTVWCFITSSSSILRFSQRSERKSKWVKL